MPRLRARVQPFEVVNPHRQEYQHQYVRAKYLDNLINVAGESRVRITIIEDVAAKTNTARIILLPTTKRKDPKSIWRSKI
jgi:hypothetical protein